MVHLVDEGSHFDAPVEMVWKFVQSGDHGSSHRDHENPQMKPLSENSAQVSWEQDMMGQRVKVVNRVTHHAPLGFTVEVLEGPIAGSKFYQFYTPKGPKTGVTIVGEFTSKMIPENQIEAVVRKNFQQVFDEDTAALKKFLAHE